MAKRGGGRMGVHHMEGISENVFVDELDRYIEREEINLILRKSRNKNAV
jgi:hypothetical protein